MARDRDQDVNIPDRKHPETIDGTTGQPADTPERELRRIDLSNLRDVRLELAVVYRKMDSGEIESQNGTRRAYVLKTIHDVIVSAELERRIVELEEKHAQRLQEARRTPSLPAHR